jgi:hypothetical protein
VRPWPEEPVLIEMSQENTVVEKSYLRPPADRIRVNPSKSDLTKTRASKRRIMTMKLSDQVDRPSLVIIAATFVMFAAALFVKGFTKEILLEVGVLLVSIKLIMMAHKNGVVASETKAMIESLHSALLELRDNEKR